MTTAYLALGSNVGDRVAHLETAYARLTESGVLLAAISKIYHTQSVEGGGPSDFLNTALRIETNLSARQLMELCQQIEADSGRAMPPRNGPRSLDIDILLFGDETHNEPDLQIPHPRMLRRAFVLRPLCDVLEGGWVEEYKSTVDFDRTTVK
jgi:2-amino-4-hydroxy-6-hydroxymethyldihydropteridine diphosphokinase